MAYVKSLDLEVEDHKKHLRRQFGSIKRSNKRAGKNYESFIEKLLVLFSDNPSISWRFVVTGWDKYPTFRVVNKRTGRINDFLRVFPSWGMAITPRVEKKYMKLFPKSGAWYGVGDQVFFKFSMFGEQKQDEYIKAIKSIIASNKDLSLNFPAHI